MISLVLNQSIRYTALSATLHYVSMRLDNLISFCVDGECEDVGSDTSSDDADARVTMDAEVEVDMDTGGTQV